MTTNVVQFIPKHEICYECYKRRATKLCDFIIGQTGITFYRSFSLFKNQQPRFLTCDKPLCDRCSNRFHGMDLCKNHFKKITGGIK